MEERIRKMAEHVIHPIPLAIRGRRMSDSVYRAPLALGPVSVIGIFVWYIEGPREKILVDCGTTAESGHDVLESSDKTYQRCHAGHDEFTGCIGHDHGTIYPANATVQPNAAGYQ